MCTACHTLITGRQAVVVQRRLMFFPGCIEEELHKATAEEQGHRVFTAFTKRLFEVALKEIWSCNNFAGGAENQSGPCLNCGGTDAMSAAFGEATGGEEADRKRRWAARGSRSRMCRGGREQGSVSHRHCHNHTVGCGRRWLWLLFKQGRQLPQTSPAQYDPHVRSPTDTHGDNAQMSVFAAQLYGTLLSFCLAPAHW